MPRDRRFRDRRDRDARRIAAILAADVVGYSRLMGADDEAALASLKAVRARFDQLVAEFDGRVFGSVGDSLMAQFASAVNAVRCAQAIQHAMQEDNAPLPAAQRMQLRIGIDLGDVIDEGGTLYGDGVNVAARLQALAEPGGILVSGAVHGQVRKRLAVRFIDVGSRPVKNIAEPVHVYALPVAAAAYRWHRLAAWLRHRGVLVALAYVAVAAGAVFAVGRYAPDTAPPWLPAALVTLLAAGFIPAIAYAWRFDARYPLPRWLRATVIMAATLVSAGTIASVWNDYLRAAGEAGISRPVPKSNPVIAVAPLRNLTGDAANDWLSEGVANLVRDGLTESKQLIVVSPVRWQTVLRTAGNATGDSAAVMTAAARAGIDYVVTGEFLPTPTGLILTTRLTDLRHGIEIGANRVPDLTPRTLLAEGARIVVLAKRTLGVPYSENVESLAADFAVDNMAAYEAYLAGVEYFLRFDYRAALRSLQAALELAPRYYIASYRLAHVQVASGDTEAALATLAAIPADAPLSRRERLYVDGARALFSRDGARAKAIFTEALRELPYDLESQHMLALAYDVSFEDEAAIAQFRRMLQQEPQNERAWTYLAETYLRLGDYLQAREALDHYLALAPDDPHGLTILGELEQFEGHHDAAITHFRNALELVPGFAPARLALARAEVIEGAWNDADARLAALIADVEVPVVFRIDAAFALNGLRLARGRFAEAIEPLEQLMPAIERERVRAPMALAQWGRALAELGRHREANALIVRAVQGSRGAATRYLFAQGALAAQRGEVAGVREAAVAIRAQHIAGDDEGARLARDDAARAAAYLDGLALLNAGESSAAVDQLDSVARMTGYPYAIYGSGLARAYLAAGRTTEALPIARAAAAWRDPGDARLDLELERMRALLLEAGILAAEGQKASAAARARAFLERWTPGSPTQADRVRAERIAAGAISADEAARASLRPSLSN